MSKAEVFQDLPLRSRSGSKELWRSGIRTIGELPEEEKDQAVAERARARWVEVIAVSQFAIRNSAANGLILGFAGSAPAELRRGVEVLASVLD